MSAFGGVMCFNRPVERALAERLNSMFVELVFAPGFEGDALEVLKQKANMRLLEDKERRRPAGRPSRTSSASAAGSSSRTATSARGRARR